MRRSLRASVPAEVLDRIALPRGERVLAAAQTTDHGWVLGTRTHLVLVDAGPVLLPWEQVESADWSEEEDRLRVVGVGEFGSPRPTYDLHLAEAALLLQLVRERVTASIVLQRPVQVDGRRAFTVIGRRSPTGGPVTWLVEYDARTDPSDPSVQAFVEDAVRRTRAEVEAPE
jgi:hypothetical protein